MQSKRDKQEIIIEKPDEDNFLVLKEAIADKEEDTKRMEEKSYKLISENQGLIEDKKRFKRILKNMNKGNKNVAISDTVNPVDKKIKTCQLSATALHYSTSGTLGLLRVPHYRTLLL